MTDKEPMTDGNGDINGFAGEMPMQGVKSAGKPLTHMKSTRRSMMAPDNWGGGGQRQSVMSTIFAKKTRSEHGHFVTQYDDEDTGLSYVEEEADSLPKEFMREFVQNILSVFGLAIFIWLYTWGVLQVNIFEASIVANLLVTSFGLAVFSIGLRQGLMPLGEKVGARLPIKAARPVVFAAIFVLGILCTIAEPAIGALQKAGEETDGQQAPLLAKVLDPATILVLMMAVGIGVGCAAVFSTCQLMFDWPIKYCLMVACIPAVCITLVCVVILEGALPAVTGLAWDCGAVTTGPVTVPIVLALGIGVAASNSAPTPGMSTEEKRMNMRRGSMLVALDPVQMDAQDNEEVPPDLAGFGMVTLASLFPVMSVWTMSFGLGGAGVTADAIMNNTAGPSSGPAVSAIEAEEHIMLVALRGTARAIFPLAGFLLFLQRCVIREPIEKVGPMSQGLLFCFLGMYLFTIGLEGALVPLGQAAGAALPEAVVLYGETYGPIVILAFGFLAGVLATGAEPALAALGETVEKLTKGKFTKAKLVNAVSLGVGMGIALGFAKVYYALSLWKIIVGGYSIAVVLTFFADDAITCIAWDSAGVTTGPVTVPIVLSCGLALAREKHAIEGFGILSCASIGPIVMVLITGILGSRRPNASVVERNPGEAEMTPWDNARPST